MWEAIRKGLLQLCGGVVVTLAANELAGIPVWICATLLFAVMVILWIWDHTPRLGWRRRLFPVTAMILGLVLFGGGALAFYLQKPAPVAVEEKPTTVAKSDPEAVSSPTAPPSELPKKAASTDTGVPPRRPLGVIMENVYIENARGAGIREDHGDNNQFKNVTIRKSGAGVVTTNSRNSTYDNIDIDLGNGPERKEEKSNDANSTGGDK